MSQCKVGCGTAHRKKRNLLHDDSEKLLQTSDTSTVMVDSLCGLLFSLCMQYTHTSSCFKIIHFLFSLLSYISANHPSFGMKSIFSMMIIRTCLEETVRKKGRCICLYIPVLWQSKIFSSLLMNVENRMCSTEQSNPWRTCLMRWKLVDDTVCRLKSPTTSVEENIWIRKELFSLFCFFSFFFNQERGEDKHQVQK